MRHCFVRAVKIALYIFAVERVVDTAFVGTLYTVIVISKSYIQAGVADVFFFEWYADNMAVFQCLANLRITVNSQSCYPLTCLHLVYRPLFCSTSINML